jgi:multidrug efflux pump subunit AcrB
MKIYYKILIIALFSLLGGIIGLFLTEKQSITTKYNSTIFTTVLSSDKNSSIEEKETSSHFFSEAILGWTLSPGFKKDINFDFSGRKQERSNLIFTLSASSKDESLKNSFILLDTIEDKLDKYNNQADTKFSLLSDNPLIKKFEPKKSYWGIMGVIAGFFIGLVLLEFFILFFYRRVS